MNMMTKVLLTTVFAGAAIVASSKVAKADECIEVGWKDRAGQWTFYRAHVDAEGGQRVHINYEYHHGELELKVFDKEKADGEDVVVMRGRWFEGKDAQRSGKVRLEMKRGHHHARGWYTNGDNEAGEHYDFQMRDCERGGGKP